MKPPRQFALPETLEPWEMVSVSWEDIYLLRGGQSSRDVSKLKPCVRRTTGYVLSWDSNYLAMAGTDDREAGLDCEDCEDISVIPRSNIRRISRV